MSGAAAPATGQAVATMAERPKVTNFRPLTQLTVGEILSDPRVKKMLADTATKHLTPDRMLRVIANAIRKVPKLGMVTPMSLLGAAITCQTLGLEPNTPLGLAYLIPFEKRGKNPATGRWETIGVEAQLIIGYQGLIDLSRRTGNLVSIHADVVYEHDEFSFEYGSGQHLRHVPKGMREGRHAVYAYAHAKLSDGEAFEVLPYAEVLRIRDNTEGYKAAMRAKANDHRGWESSPWIAFEHEMACKTMVRRLSKWLPKSIEFANAVALDNMGDRGAVDFAAIASDPSLAGDPEMVEVHDTRDAGGGEGSGGATVETEKKPVVETARTVTETEQTQQTEQDQTTSDISDMAQKIIDELGDLKTKAAITEFEEIIAADMAKLTATERGRYNAAKLERLKALAAKK